MDFSSSVNHLGRDLFRDNAKLPFTTVALPPLPSHAPDAPSVRAQAIPSSRALPPLRDNRFPARSLPSFDENFRPESDAGSHRQRVVIYQSEQGGRRSRARSPSPESPVAPRSSRDHVESSRVSAHHQRTRVKSTCRGIEDRYDQFDGHHYTHGQNSWSSGDDSSYLRDDTPALLPDEGDESDCSDHFDAPAPPPRRSRSGRQSSTYRHKQRRRVPYDIRTPARHAMVPAVSEAYSPVLAGQTPWSPFLPQFQQMSLSPSSPAMPFMYGPVPHPDPNHVGDLTYVAYYTVPRMGHQTGMPIPRPSRRRPSISGYQRSVSARETRLGSIHPQNVQPKAETEHRSRRSRATTLSQGWPPADHQSASGIASGSEGFRPACSLPQDSHTQQPFSHDVMADDLMSSHEAPGPYPVPEAVTEETAEFPACRPTQVKQEPDIKSYCPGYVWDVLASKSIVAKYKEDKAARAGTIYEKPAGSYCMLIGQALIEAPNPHQLDVASVFESIAAKYPYFTLDPRLLYNGVRHQINANAAFTRVQRLHGDPNARIRKWCITPGYEYWFIDGLEREKRERKPRRTVSESSSIGPFEMEMDDSPEIPLRMLFEADERRRAETPEAAIRNSDVDRTPMGPNNNRTPLARGSAERPPRLDMQAIRSHSMMSGLSAPTEGDLTPALSLDGGSSARPSSYPLNELPLLSIMEEATRSRSREIASPDSCLGFPSSNFTATSTFLSQQSSRVPLGSKTNYQPSSTLGFSPFANSKPPSGKEQHGGYQQSPDIHSPLPQLSTGSGLQKPVPIRSLSALSSTRPGSATTSVSNSTVSSLASAMDVTLVRSRNA